MSDEAGSAPGAAGKGRGMIVLAAVASLVVGGAAGAFALGPMLANRGHAQEPAAESGEGGGGHGGGSGSTSVFAVENLVVNPAGTQGTRFLIASVAVEASDAAASAAMNARDPEIRDRLLSLLSGRTVEELSDLDGREALKEEIRAEIEQVVGRGRVVRVFIPQYVLQ